MVFDVEIIRVVDILWYIYNVFLVIGVVVMIWWNIWFSFIGGRCGVDFILRLLGSDWIKIWFYFIMDERVKFGFLFLVWMLFVVLGLFYGRIILVWVWSLKVIMLGNVFVSLGFILVFVFVRIFYVGNLFEGCLSMVEY